VTHKATTALWSIWWESRTDSYSLDGRRCRANDYTIAVVNDDVKTL